MYFYGAQPEAEPQFPRGISRLPRPSVHRDQIAAHPAIRGREGDRLARQVEGAFQVHLVAGGGPLIGLDEAHLGPQQAVDQQVALPIDGLIGALGYFVTLGKSATVAAGGGVTSYNAASMGFGRAGLIEAITVIRQLWTGKDVSFKGKYYTVDAKLYDAPAKPIPLMTAANGKKSMRLAGQHGDGFISDPESWKKWKSEWEAGARETGKNPADMPVLIEHYAVVGDQEAAKQAAELWRFGPRAWKSLFDVRDPTAIQQQAEQQVPIEQVLKSWAVGTDPQVHINAVKELFDSGATIVNIHSGQPDQKRVIEFYAAKVLPRFA